MGSSRLIKKIAMSRPIRSVLDIFIKHEQHDSLADPVEIGQDVTVDWPRDLKKPLVGLIRDEYENVGDHSICYWEKYRKFLKHNRIRYDFVDIDRRDWMDQVKKFDMIIWHPHSDPATLANAKSKIYFMEKHLGKICYPPYREMWYYEDKVRLAYLFELHDLPLVKTFITNDRKEAEEYVKTAKYPFISKIRTGAGSRGVELIRDRKSAEKFVKEVFERGRETYWSYIRQKGYVYFQEYVPDLEYDLRIIVVGNKYQGYYKMTPEKDFRASGAGIIEKKDLPEEALDIARKVKDRLKANTLAVDMVYCEKEKKYRIIETSIFVQIRTTRQLIIDGIPGYYEFTDGEYVFKEGRFWTQEWTLEEVMNEWIRDHSK
ncbi:MAG: ATP-grasp domain-containing protein [Thermoplasmatota archaeon]